MIGTIEAREARIGELIASTKSGEAFRVEGVVGEGPEEHVVLARVGGRFEGMGGMILVRRIVDGDRRYFSPEAPVFALDRRDDRRGAVR